jgi:16S rRNA (cytosine1402-N4)-methyltransferase
MKHTPVLLREVIQYLNPQSGDFIIDGTINGGGHAAAISEKILPNGKMLGVDWDEAMIEARKKALSLQEKKNLLLFHGNYANLPDILAKEKLPKANGLLLDLGFSSEQIAASGRGFSFSEASKDELLLMTYDDSREPVWKILRSLDEKSLANVIYEFGGERRSRQIAKLIKERERRKAIMTAGELADIVREALPGKYEHGRIHPATRTFQALRIYANGEFENLSRILEHLGSVVAPGGRVVILTFHSLEDRIVKQAFQKMAKEKTAELLTKKPVPPTREEIKENPRSRSAKLRAITIL